MRRPHVTVPGGDVEATATASNDRTPPSLPLPDATVDTFHDPVLESRFRELGYVVVDFLTPAAAADLLTVCRGLHPAPTEGARAWECDFYAEERHTKETAAAAIAEAFAAPVDHVLRDHRTFLHNFVLNWPGPDGGLELHQHSSTVDEREFRSAVIWCALNDSTEANGTLHVVPRSHRVLQGHKAERGPEWIDGLRDELLADHLTSIPLRAGQALIFDNGLLHCSFPNRTDTPRVTGVATVAPRTAELRYFDCAGSSVQVYRLDPEFFLGNVSAGMEWATPEGLELIGTEPVASPSLTADDLLLLLGGEPPTCRHALEPSSVTAPSS